MANDLQLAIRLTGDNRQLVGTLRDSERGVRRFGDTSEQQSARVASALNGIRTAAGFALAAVGGLTLGRVINETAQFEDTMLGLRAVSGATADEMERLERQARTLGATTRYSARQAGEAQRFLAQAGFDVNEVLSATPGILNLATAGQMDLAQAADIASNVLGGMRLPVSELNRVMDVMAAAAASSNTNIQQLGSALSEAAPIAATAGLSIEETATAISVLSNAGIQGGRSGTAVLGFIRQLSNITPQAQSVLLSYGLTLQDVNLETHGLADVLDTLLKANISTADAFKIFASEAGPAAQVLTNGAEGAREYIERLRDATGATDEMAAILGSGLSSSLRTFNSALSESILQIGEGGLGGAVGDLADTGAGVLSVYNGMIDTFAEANDLTDQQVDRVETLARSLQVSAGAAGGAAVAYGGYRAATIASTAATAAFNAVARANPLVRVATVAAAAAGALYSVRNATAEINGETIRLGDLAEPVMNDLASGAMTVTNALTQRLGPGVDDIVQRIGEITFSDVVNEMAAGIDRSLALWSGFTESMEVTWDKFVVTLGPRLIGALNPVLSQLNDLANWKPPWLRGVLPDWGIDFTIHLPDESSVANAGRSLGDAFNDGYRRAMDEGPSATDYVNRLIGDASTNRQLHEFQQIVDAIFHPSGAGAKGAPAIDGGKNSIDALTGSVGKASKALETYSDSFNALMDRLYPVRRAQREYYESQLLLQTAWASGELSIDHYLEALQRLKTSYQSTAHWQETYGLTGQQANQRIQASVDPAAVAVERGIERMDDAFVGFWENVLSGSKNTFDAFRQVAISTLAEVIHAYTTRQITASISTAISGSSGSVSGMNGGGFGTGGMDLMSLGRNVYNGVVDGFGSIQWTGAPTGATSYRQGFGSQIATGGGRFGGSLENFQGWNGIGSVGTAYAGNRLGNSIWGESRYGDTLSTIGGTVGTYFGGPVGAGIGSFVGSGLGALGDSLFGSSREPFVKTWQGARHADPVNFYRDYYRDTDLGMVGVLDKQKLDPEPIVEWVNAIEQADNALAAMLDQRQLSAVRETLAVPTKDKGTDLESVAVDRYNRAIGAIQSASDGVVKDLVSRVGVITKDSFDQQIDQLARALQLGNMIDALSDNVQNYAARVVADTSTSLEDAFDQISAGVAAYSAVSAISDQLSLTFDALGDRAVDVALDVARLTGGLESLQTSAQTYYQNFFSESERFDRLSTDLASTFGALGLALPDTRSGVRALVESLDLMSESGREQYAAVMNNIDAVSQYVSAMEEQRRAAQETARAAQDAAAAELAAAQARQTLLTGASLVTSGMADVIHQALTSYQRQQSAADELSRTREAQLNNERRAIQSISSLLDAMRLSDQSILNPKERLVEARRQFAALQVRAENGDADAINQMGGARNDYLSAAGDYYGQASRQYAAIYHDVESSLSGLERHFRDSVSAQNAQENVQQQALNEQRRARETLLSSLQQQVQQSTQLDSIAELLSMLPPSLASSLSDIFPEYGVDVGANGFDESAYLANKTAQTNATRQSGRGDWTADEVLAQIEASGMTPYEHYQRYGRSEGVSPGYQPGQDTISQQTKRFNENVYVANQVDYLNDRDRGERSWSALQFYMALKDAHLSPYEHWQKYGRSEGVDAYAKGGAFTNGVVSEPTYFNSAVMGEAGPEAIMPLTRTADGSLGIRSLSPALETSRAPGVDIQPIVNELQALRRDNAELRARLDALVDAGRDTAIATRETAEYSKNTAGHTARTERNTRMSRRGVGA